MGLLQWGRSFVGAEAQKVSVGWGAAHLQLLSEVTIFSLINIMRFSVSTGFKSEISLSKCFCFPYPPSSPCLLTLITWEVEMTSATLLLATKWQNRWDAHVCALKTQQDEWRCPRRSLGFVVSGAVHSPRRRRKNNRNNFVDWFWSEAFDCCSLLLWCQRSLINSHEKILYSGEVWDAKLYSKLNFYLFLFIVESLKGGFFLVELWSLLFWWMLWQLSGHESLKLTIANVFNRKANRIVDW